MLDSGNGSTARLERSSASIVGITATVAVWGALLALPCCQMLFVGRDPLFETTKENWRDVWGRVAFDTSVIVRAACALRRADTRRGNGGQAQ